MATKRLKRGKAIRVPAAGTVTIQKDGAVVFKPARKRKKNPAKPRRAATRKTAPKRRPRPTAKKRATKRTKKARR